MARGERIALDTITPWLDVHVIQLDSTHAPWQQQCLASIEVARQQAGFPIAVHYVQGVVGQIGQSRHNAYTQGDAPYVTNVDDDDYLLPEAFAALREGLLANVDVIFPREMECHCGIEGDIVNEGSLRKGRQRHSMKVFQRQHLIDHRSWIWAGDVAQARYLETLPSILDVSTPTYVWRVYSQSNSMPFRLQHPFELKRARAEVPVLLYPSNRKSST